MAQEEEKFDVYTGKDGKRYSVDMRQTGIY